MKTCNDINMITIYVIHVFSLMCIDEVFTWETEPMRKLLHDRILA